MAFPHTTRVNAATMNMWLQEVDAVKHQSVIYAKLQSEGRIKRGKGRGITWPMRYMRRDLNEVPGPVTQTNFPQTNDRRMAYLDMSGYDLGESILKAEKLANSGSKEQLWDLIQKTWEEQMEDAVIAYARRLWQDGSITGQGLMGMLSLYGGSATPSRNVYNQPDHTNYPPITCADGVTTWWACAPTQTYAGVSTALGAEVNDYSNSTTSEAFPYPDFSEAYHFNTPLMIDYNSARFTPQSGSTHNWKQQWQEAFNAMVTWQEILTGEPVELVCWHGRLKQDAENSLIDKERFIVSDSSPIRALGFQALSYNGVDTLTEFGVPSGMGISLNFKRMTLYNWQEQLFYTESDIDLASSADLRKIDVYSQLQLDSARYFPALVPASAEGT